MALCSGESMIQLLSRSCSNPEIEIEASCSGFRSASTCISFGSAFIARSEIISVDIASMRLLILGVDNLGRVTLS